MIRRLAKNKTGIPRVEGIPYKDAWISFSCINCRKRNYILIGKQLLHPSTAYNEAIWKCDYCGFIHSKDADLPFKTWPKKFVKANSNKAIRFWEAFFRIATEHKESYWKQCNVCGRILPFHAFSKHSKWFPLELQMECRSCKGAINADLNPKRTKEQLNESSTRRRIGDMLLEGNNKKISHDELFKRFGGRCFKTKKKLDIKDRKSWAIDHILPSKFLYPLNVSNAALLSKKANENKRDKWPSEFYTNSELIQLAKITGADLSLLSSKDPIINPNIDVNKCVDRFLTVREKSDLKKRILELKNLLASYDLVKKLSEKNKKILGL